MSTYNEFLQKFLFESGFLSENDFNEVMESFPGLEFNVDKIPIFESVVYDQDMVAEEVVYSKLYEEGLDTDEISLTDWSVDFDSKQIDLGYEVAEGYTLPIDQIKGYFPNYTVEIEIYNQE